VLRGVVVRNVHLQNGFRRLHQFRDKIGAEIRHISLLRRVVMGLHCGRL
jgi:hypothetical protein